MKKKAQSNVIFHSHVKINRDTLIMKIRHFITFILLIYSTQALANPMQGFYGKWALKIERPFKIKTYELEIIPEDKILQTKTTINDGEVTIKKTTTEYWGKYKIKRYYTVDNEKYHETFNGVWFIDPLKRGDAFTKLILTKHKRIEDVGFTLEVPKKERHWIILFKPGIHKNNIKFFILPFDNDKLIYTVRGKRIEQIEQKDEQKDEQKNRHLEL